MQRRGCNCGADDGGSTSAPQLGRFSGSGHHEVTTTNYDGEVYIRFTSDGSVSSGKSYRFQTDCVHGTRSPPACGTPNGRIEVLSSDSSSYSLELVGGAYANGRDCTWKVR